MPLIDPSLFMKRVATINVADGDVEKVANFTDVGTTDYIVEWSASWNTTVWIDEADRGTTSVKLRFGTPVPGSGHKLRVVIVFL